ncbi:MAG: formimidoylglutamate deiminase [Proteobacteria bacterium]|nr:formimidoylglutamate deiminase [Pseudomonadota bacterium]
MSSLWFEHALLPEGWARGVRISEQAGRIATLHRGVEAGEGDERHAIGLPGLPNLHSHAFQRALAGLTERRGAGQDSFWSWRELMYRFVSRLDPQDLEAITAFAFAQMLEAGFTHVAEFHYLHHAAGGTPYTDVGELAARVAAAAAATGMGLTLLPVLYAHSGFGGAAPGERQLRFINDVDRYTRLLARSREVVAPLPGATVGIAPHSLRAVTPQELTAALAAAGEGPVHIHIAEQVQEVQDCLAWSGQRPVEWLLAHHGLDERWCLVHATHVNEGELAGMVASRAVVGLCPITESSLGDGIFPAAALMQRAGRYGVGSDSNIQLDAAGELRTLEYSQRLQLRSRNVLTAPGASTGRSLFEACVRGGAQAVGRGAPGEAGLTAGAWLDLVSLDAQHPLLVGRAHDEWLDSWIFAGGNDLIDCVWRAGRRVVSRGRHRDHEALAARYRQALGRLLA